MTDLTELTELSAKEVPLQDRLRLLLERIERLEDEKKCLSDDIRDMYSEAKSTGYDAKIMHQIVRLNRIADELREMQAVLDAYCAALGLD